MRLILYQQPSNSNNASERWRIDQGCQSLTQAHWLFIGQNGKKRLISPHIPAWQHRCCSRNGRIHGHQRLLARCTNSSSINISRFSTCRAAERPCMIHGLNPRIGNRTQRFHGRLARQTSAKNCAERSGAKHNLILTTQQCRRRCRRRRVDLLPAPQGVALRQHR